MEKKTYGAPRLVDWVAQIKAGAATLKVHFTGGALTTYGVTPAEYTTSDPFIQRVIENSTYFKEGRIILVRKSEIAESPKRKVKAMAQSMPQAEAEKSTEADAEPGAETEKAVEACKKEVEVTCLQDAQAYLQESYGISTYKVRSYEAAQRVAAEHGVRFTGAKFDTLAVEE